MNHPLVEAMLHLGNGQLKNGLVEDAIETFSAALFLDDSDDRLIQARALAYDKRDLHS